MRRSTGQLCLRDKSVLVVGIGGLGCPAATYLAGAGVGTIGLIDGDTVELSNLHRQILHSTSTIGQLKVNSAQDHLRRYVITMCWVFSAKAGGTQYQPQYQVYHLRRPSSLSSRCRSIPALRHYPGLHRSPKVTLSDL